MAESGVDISQLSEDQQLALQQFTAVTDQEIQAAIPLLQRCQWNVQIAIARFFDGEPADPVADAVANPPPPQSTRRQETLLNGFTSSSRSPSRHTFEPAPRVVPQPENQVAYQAPLILSLFITPFNLLLRLVSRSFSLITYLFPFLPRYFARVTAGSSPQARRSHTSGRRPLNTRDTAARFIREFEEEYGIHELPFQETGYSQAFDKAKKELKFLLIILLSPEHDDTSSFVKETLLAPDVINFVKNAENSIILWGGDVRDSEAYQVSTALSCTKLPFAGLVVHTPAVSSTSMSIVARIAGPVPPATFLTRLRTAISQNTESLSRVRATRAEQQATRNLREAQDSAYERSLAQDRERARRRKEEEEARARAEREEKERAEAKENEARDLEQWRKWRAKSTRGEPAADLKNAVRISLRMPSGERVIRRFYPDAPIEDLYAFVECYDVLQDDDETAAAQKPKGFQHEYKFRLVSPMPREVFELEAGGTVAERIGRSGNLIVEKIVSDEDDEEDEDES